jgi:3-hydroxyacyl-CoA dehydrogenase
MPNLGEKCVVALNSGVDLISESVTALDLPQERTFGMNFLKMSGENKIVEIVKTDNTKDEYMDLVGEFLTKMGKKFVIVRDNPGAIAERLLRPFIQASFNALSVGKGYPHEIDKAFKNMAGASKGPFELIDSVGVGKDYARAVKIYELLGQPERLKPPDIYSKIVQYGQLGKSSGMGIYIYEDGKIAGENPMLFNLIKYLGLKKVSESEIFAEIFRPVMEEAKVLASEIMVSENDIENIAKLGFGWSKGIFNLYRENKEMLQPKKRSEFENLESF